MFSINVIPLEKMRVLFIDEKEYLIMVPLSTLEG